MNNYYGFKMNRDGNVRNFDLFQRLNGVETTIMNIEGANGNIGIGGFRKTNRRLFINGEFQVDGTSYLENLNVERQATINDLSVNNIEVVDSSLNNVSINGELTTKKFVFNIDNGNGKILIGQEINIYQNKFLVI